MKTRLLSAAAATLSVALMVGSAQADSFSFGDYFFPGDTPPNGFSSFTDDLVAYQASGPGTGFTIFEEGSGWAGEFVRNTTLLFDNGAPGAVIINFQSPITSITGLAAQPSLDGAYTATLDAYDGATFLGSSRYNGFNAPGPEGTISNFDFAAPEITSIVISTTNDAGGFAIGGGIGIPEPGAWTLMLAGFSSLGVAMRTRRRLIAEAA